MSGDVAFLTINSRDRIRGTAGSYTVPVQSFHFRNIVEYDCERFEIPNTIYKVKPGNDTLVFRENAVAPFVYSTIQLEAGNYDAASFANAILLLAGPTGTNKISAAEVSATTGKLVLTTVPANLWVYAPAGASEVDPAAPGVTGEIFGFTQNTLQPTATDDIVSQNFIVLANTFTLYLRIEEFNRQRAFNELVSSDPKFTNSISARIQLNANSGTIYYYDEPQRNVRSFQFDSPVSINQLTITWLDERHEVVDFNGAEHSFVIRLRMKAARSA